MHGLFRGWQDFPFFTFYTTGIVALQVMDAMYPGMVPLSKVNWNAKNEYEYSKNLKVVQAVFMKVGIEKVALTLPCRIWFNPVLSCPKLQIARKDVATHLLTWVAQKY